MGSQESKVEQPPKQEDEMKETTLSESAPSSPILTPLDPRSPSVNIARTPLDAIMGAKTGEESTDELEEDNNTENKDSVNVILGVDPRSPTVEFNRTPIIVGAVAKDKSKKLQNKNLDNVRKHEIQTTPVAHPKKSNIIPPKLLDVSPVSVVTNYKRKSFVGLLETNIDFTETDLDKVCQTKESLNKSLPVEMVEDLPCNKLKEQMETLQIAALNKVTPETPEEDEEHEKEFELSTKPVEEKSINVTAQVKDFDKKLTNLIYEDDSGDDKRLSLRVTKLKEGSRTPLSVRNSNEDTNKKGTSRLRVSDKPRRSDSKIPIFKDHYYKKVGVQCENTPPNHFEESHKPKISHWDADKTLVI